MKTDNIYHYAFGITLSDVLKILDTLTEKVDSLKKQIDYLAHLYRKVEEIHALHFPKNALEQTLTSKRNSSLKSF